MSENAARILVVDDQRVHRDKLMLAVRALGHQVDAVANGAAALARLNAESFDLVLLDILMPDMDGFEVMTFMQRDRRLRDIPVIVVSALEGEMAAVVRAVEIGAEDVLPKRFDPVLLEARLDSALERRRVRAREIEHHHHMNLLTDAAALLERHSIEPQHLPIEQTCQREDAIGRLARVFRAMSRNVHARDTRLQQQLGLLRKIGLTLVVGAVMGLLPVLARTGMLIATDPIGMALWISAFCTLICLPSALWRPRLLGSGRKLASRVILLCVTGALCGVLPLLWLARELPASMLATVLPAEAALAFGLHALVSRRWPSPQRLAVLLLGVTAILWLAIGPTDETLPWRDGTLLVALLVPLGWAAAGLVVRWPADDPPAPVESAQLRVDALALVGLVSLLSMLCLAVTAGYTGADIPLFTNDTASPQLHGLPDALPSGIGALLAAALLAVVLVAGATLRIVLLSEGGVETAVGASFAITLCALVWSVLLLSESLQPSTAIPLLLFGLGLIALSAGARRQKGAAVSTIDLELG